MFFPTYITLGRHLTLKHRKQSILVESDKLDLSAQSSLEKLKHRGTWMAQSEQHPTLDLGIMSLSAVVGVEITQTNKT